MLVHESGSLELFVFFVFLIHIYIKSVGLILLWKVVYKKEYNFENISHCKIIKKIYNIKKKLK